MKRVRKIPNVYRDVQDNSITLTFGKPSFTLIWLHGMCDTADGFQSFFSHSRSPLYAGAKIKLIQAPLRNITVNKGQVCHAWYDMRSFNRFVGNQEDVFNLGDIKESLEIVEEHVEEEAREWHREEPQALISPYHRIFIGGFSQGGFMALHYSLQAKNVPAGALSLSGYLLKSTPLSNLKKLPILLMHGSKDPQVRELEAKKSYSNILTDQNLVDYKCMENLQHTVNLQQLDQLTDWFKATNTMIDRNYKAK